MIESLSLNDWIRIEKKVRQQPRLSVQDLAAQTGLALADAENVIERLLEKYHCRLQVTAEGHIIYDFENFKLRNIQEWKKKLQHWFETFWVYGQYGLRVWIGLFTISYFLVSAIGLTMITGQSLGLENLFFEDKKEKKLKSKSKKANFENIFVSFWKSVTQWKKVGENIVEQKETEGKKNWVEAVYQFVFGKNKPKNPLSEAQKTAQWISQQNGILTVEDVQLLTGTDRNEAERLFSEVLVRFEGKPEVNEEGLLYGHFETLLRQTQSTNEKIGFFYEKEEPLAVITGNTEKQNQHIVGLGAITLISSVIFSFDVYENFFLLRWIPNIWLNVFLGWIPLAYMIPFFSLPFVRIFQQEFWINPKIKQQNLERKVFKAIVENEWESMSLKTLIGKIFKNNRASQAKKVAEILKKWQLDFGFEIVAEEKKGEIVYSFAGFKTQLDKIQAFRNQFDQQNFQTDIVFDTNEHE